MLSGQLRSRAGLLLRRMGDRQAAEDVAAQTFLVAWRREEVHPPTSCRGSSGSRGTCLVSAAACVDGSDCCRGGLRPTPTSRESHGVPTTPASIRVALAELSAPDREVLMLTTSDGLDQGHAAAVLGCSLGALRCVCTAPVTSSLLPWTTSRTP